MSLPRTGTTLRLVRSSCAWVASQSRSVYISEDAIAHVASGFARSPMAWDSELHFNSPDQEAMVQCLLVQDACNFCFWPVGGASLSLSPGPAV